MIQSDKHLQFVAGPHQLLAHTNLVLQILRCQPAWWAQAGTASALHGQAVNWRNQPLPFLSLRRCLGLPDAEPVHALVLQDEQGKPAVLLAVDTVRGILSLEEEQLFPFQGIHAELDTFFDAVHLDHTQDRLLLRLKPASHWLATAITHDN